MALCGILKVVEVPTPVFVADQLPHDTFTACVNVEVVRLMLTVNVFDVLMILNVAGELLGVDMRYKRSVDVHVFVPKFVLPL